ncbi:MAG TPA: zf-HC2 domain-containing protein [Solirubrobacteraceae bacterium]|nr:zf-HC2 domain-containing protein [Solirubrobacteraceae bacterium]
MGAYVLGALEPDEAAEMRRHLQECPDCAAERDALVPLPNLLSLAGGADAAVNEPLSPAFEERLLDAYAREHSDMPRRRMGRLRRRLRPRWIAVGATAAVAAAAALAIVVLGGDERGGNYNVEFRNVGAPGATAQARLDSSDSGTTVHLLVNGLPKDAVYEVMCDAPMWTASAGTFRTSPDGHAYVVLTTAMRRGEYDAIRIVKRGHRADGKLVRMNILTARLS